MTSQAQPQALEQLLREGPLDLGGDLAEQRPPLETLLTTQPLPEDVTTTPGTLGGVPRRRHHPDRRGLPGQRGPYLHGGAYAMGSATAGAGLASDIARRAGARAVSVDYRLAPEHPYPAALQDAVAAYRGRHTGSVSEVGAVSLAATRAYGPSSEMTASALNA
jgi:monoterpene epsilon-lactone hydrolase